MSRNAATRAVFVSLALVGLVAGPGLADQRENAFRRSGYAGTERATMRTETVPARIGRVAEARGTREVWAIGYSLAMRPGWDKASDAGQLVFLKHGKTGGWSIAGAPTDRNGRVLDPTLFALDLSPRGEGWAVGEQGIMLHKRAGQDRWVLDESASALAGEADLVSVSLTENGGFAVGTESTILRYDGTSWRREPATAQMSADGSPDLGSVSAVSADEAWAVTAPSTADLRVYHRNGGSWVQVTTDSSPQNPIFAGPHPATASNGGLVLGAFGAAVAADARGAWVGGALIPADPVHPQGDPAPGDTTRPFVLRLENGKQPISYCPDQYGLRQGAAGVEADQKALCTHPFPTSAFGVTSLEIAGDDVFAGGLGLFRRTGTGWVREPDSAGYLISLAFLDANDGWVATTGNTFGAGGAIHSSEAIVGRWTNRHPKPGAARWPQPQSQPLLGVDIAPDGSGRALAVGSEGAVVFYIPGAGWDSVDRPTTEDFHDVAWSGSNSAWAVGAQGLLARFDGRRWHTAPPDERATRSTLFAVAFDGNEGIAVGAQGTVLRYRDGAWTKDPASGKVTKEDLYDVAFTDDGAIAVGDGGTVIEDRGDGFSNAPAVRGMLTRGASGAPALYSIAALRTGEVYVAGARSALLVRPPGGAFRAFEPPIEGTILAIAGHRTANGSLRLFASVSTDANKFNGDQVAATRGSIIGYDGRWKDLGLDRRRTMYVTTDSSSFTDPAFAISVDADGRAWASGGFPANTPDLEGHLRFHPTSSLYRIDLDGDPSPGFLTAEPTLREVGLTFAFFSDTWCGQGLCSAALGSGTQADLVAMAIRDEIAKVSEVPNGPRFVMFGGNGRSAGLPEELGQEAAFLQGFGVPVFGALGSRDLFTATAVDTSGAPSTGQSAQDPSSYWQSEFGSGFPAPWGQSKSPPAIKEVSCGGCAAPSAGARTHYAFDYEQNGRKIARIIVVDSSSRSYGSPAGTDQNPPERQDEWLSKILADAKLQNNLAGVPTVIVMNQPTLIPDRTPQLNWTNGPADAANFQSTVVANAVSAVLTGGLRMATRDGFPNSDNRVVPIYIMGTGGAPLGYDLPNPGSPPPSKLPTDGYYNAWFLVRIDPSQRPYRGLPGQVRVDVTPFPILESLAMHAADGRSAQAGATLRFSALGRSLPGGTSDPEQSRAAYYPIGFSNLIECDAPGQGYGICKNRDALQIPYRFYSEDPAIADFVVPDTGRGGLVPERRDGKVVREADGQSGLLCTFKTGSTYVNAVSGLHRARMRITVTGGFGPCVDKPVPVEQQPRPVVKGKRVLRDEFEPEVRRFRPPPQPNVVAVFPPPPAPILAPAPPGAPGVGRKEEHEVEYEQEGHSHDHRSVARERTSAARTYAFRSASRSDVPSPPIALGVIVLLAFAGASVGAAARRRHEVARQEVRR